MYVFIIVLGYLCNHEELMMCVNIINVTLVIRYLNCEDSEIYVLI